MWRAVGQFHRGVPDVLPGVSAGAGWGRFSCQGGRQQWRGNGESDGWEFSGAGGAVCGGADRVLRESVLELEVRRRGARALMELIEAAIVRRTDREMTEMAFKGSKPGKGSGGGKGDNQAELLKQYRDLVETQANVIHAMAQAILSIEEVEGEEGEDEENEDKNEDEDKE